MCCHVVLATCVNHGHIVPALWYCMGCQEGHVFYRMLEVWALLLENNSNLNLTTCVSMYVRVSFIVGFVCVHAYVCVLSKCVYMCICVCCLKYILGVHIVKYTLSLFVTM